MNSRVPGSLCSLFMSLTKCALNLMGHSQTLGPSLCIHIYIHIFRTITNYEPNSKAKSCKLCFSYVSWICVLEMQMNCALIRSRESSQVKREVKLQLILGFRVLGFRVAIIKRNLRLHFSTISLLCLYCGEERFRFNSNHRH